MPEERWQAKGLLFIAFIMQICLLGFSALPPFPTLYFIIVNDSKQKCLLWKGGDKSQEGNHNRAVVVHTKDWKEPVTLWSPSWLVCSLFMDVGLRVSGLKWHISSNNYIRIKMVKVNSANQFSLICNGMPLSLTCIPLYILLPLSISQHNKSMSLERRTGWKSSNQLSCLKWD